MKSNRMNGLGGLIHEVEKKKMIGFRFDYLTVEFWLIISPRNQSNDKTNRWPFTNNVINRHHKSFHNEVLLICIQRRLCDPTGHSTEHLIEWFQVRADKIHLFWWAFGTNEQYFWFNPKNEWSIGRTDGHELWTNFTGIILSMGCDAILTSHQNMTKLKVLIRCWITMYTLAFLNPYAYASNKFYSNFK